MRVGVVGHVEYVEFAVVERMPAAGEIVHARESFGAPAGGGAVAAVVMAELAGGVTLWTAFGDDAVGDRAIAELQALGVDVRAERVPRPTRRGFTHLSDDGERTITVLGPRLMPSEVDVSGYAGIYLTAGDADVIAAVRAARVVVATPRVGPALVGAEVDVVVGSARDPGERVDPGVGARVVVQTDGADGGTWTASDGSSGGWEPAPLPGPVLDAYGCGDAFAAALTYELAGGATIDDACAAAARAGARRLTLRGPYG